MVQSNNEMRLWAQTSSRFYLQSKQPKGLGLKLEATELSRIPPPAPAQQAHGEVQRRQGEPNQTASTLPLLLPKPAKSAVPYPPKGGPS